MQQQKMSSMRSPEISGPSVSSARSAVVAQSSSNQRSLVADDPDSERLPARTVCAAFSLFVLGLVRGKAIAVSQQR